MLYEQLAFGGVAGDAGEDQGLDAEGGRGLFLVGALATRWDVRHPPRGGKVVWVELALPPANSAR